ncbi:hypothetical protein GJ496_011135 [Pomphorhynchus laevis]|nr:hypothetical protein GJ496_011135 [Pomphorhynchus laevis]
MVWNLHALISGPLRDDNACVEWLETLEIALWRLQDRTCSHHNRLMKKYKEKHLSRFRCSAQGCKDIAVTKGTWLEYAKISPAKAIMISYCFATKMSILPTIRESSITGERTSTETITDWYNYCREVCMELMFRRTTGTKMGRPGRIVQIDECKLGRRKYNRGRMRDGTWVLGLIEDNGDCRLKMCEDNLRNSSSLVPFIVDNVNMGTTIHTDLWGAYSQLKQLGFVHEIINQSQIF